MKDQPVDNTPPIQPSVEPTPVQQWQQTPPAQAQVQYVVAQQSLDGIGGWLIFWLIVFSINGIAYISVFFNLLSAGINTPSDTLLVLFSPLLSVFYLGSVVLIALRKKLGMWASMASIGLATLYTVINTIIAAGGGYSGANVGAALAGVVTSIVFGGLMVLYFYTSKRVKATLVK